MVVANTDNTTDLAMAATQTLLPMASNSSDIATLAMEANATLVQSTSDTNTAALKAEDETFINGCPVATNLSLLFGQYTPPALPAFEDTTCIQNVHDHTPRFGKRPTLTMSFPVHKRKEVTMFGVLWLVLLLYLHSFLPGRQCS